MDPVLYIAAAVILLALIFFAVKVRGRTEQADLEHRRDVVQAAMAHLRVAEERGAGMPRRRRNMAAVMAQRRPQAEEREPDQYEPEDEEDAEEPQNFQPTAKMGAKKQRKLEEKQAKKAQREAEIEEREERRRMQELRDQEKKQEEERERQMELKQEEAERRVKEEQERRDEEEYQKLKAEFVIEDQGEAEQLTEDQSRSLLQEFIQYIENLKVVLLEDLASHFGMRTQDAIKRVQDLLADGSLTVNPSACALASHALSLQSFPETLLTAGVIDDRGKFISITPGELESVAQFMRQRGRVSISELAQASNRLIRLSPECPVAV